MGQAWDTHSNGSHLARQCIHCWQWIQFKSHQEGISFKFAGSTLGVKEWPWLTSASARWREPFVSCFCNPCLWFLRTFFLFSLALSELEKRVNMFLEGLTMSKKVGMHGLNKSWRLQFFSRGTNGFFGKPAKILIHFRPTCFCHLIHKCPVNAICLFSGPRLLSFSYQMGVSSLFWSFSWVSLVDQVCFTGLFWNSISQIFSPTLRNGWISRISLILLISLKNGSVATNMYHSLP